MPSAWIRAINWKLTEATERRDVHNRCRQISKYVDPCKPIFLLGLIIRSVIAFVHKEEMLPIKQNSYVVTISTRLLFTDKMTKPVCQAIHFTYRISLMVLPCIYFVLITLLDTISKRLRTHYHFTASQSKRLRIYFNSPEMFSDFSTNILMWAILYTVG